MKFEGCLIVLASVLSIAVFCLICFTVAHFILKLW
jgi:hypothetical protein